jgi:hypothetical protein
MTITTIPATWIAQAIQCHCGHVGVDLHPVYDGDPWPELWDDEVQVTANGNDWRDTVRKVLVTLNRRTGWGISTCATVTGMEGSDFELEVCRFIYDEFGPCCTQDPATIEVIDA